MVVSEGSAGYTRISSFDNEDYQVDLNYFFNGSSRRTGILNE